MKRNKKQLNELGLTTTALWTGRPAKVQNLDWNGKQIIPEAKVKEGDRVKIDLNKLGNLNTPQFKKLLKSELQYGNGSVKVISIKNNQAHIAADDITAQIDKIMVPVESLVKVNESTESNINLHNVKLTSLVKKG